MLAARTDRRVVAPGTLLLANQVSGSFSVLRREVLDTALPFPRLAVATQMHDHWLGLCAAVGAGYTVVDEPLQDYVQHGGNLVGEVERRHPRTPWGALRLLSRLAADRTGRRGPTALVRTAHETGIGWRRMLVRTLVARCPAEPAVARMDRQVGQPSVVRTLAAIAGGLRSGDVPVGTALTLAAGLPVEAAAALVPAVATPSPLTGRAS